MLKVLAEYIGAQPGFHVNTVFYRGIRGTSCTPSLFFEQKKLSKDERKWDASGENS